MPEDSTTPTTTPRTLTATVEGIGPVEVTYSERGAGHPFLLLHGGAGPLSVTAFADLFARSESARVITPTHPGFAGTARPELLANPRGLAALYVAFLDQLDLSDVTLIGNSVGGWIAAEMALLGSPRIARVVLVDAVGVDVPGHPVADFFSLTMDQVAALSYHDPIAFRIDVAAMPPAQREAMAGNRAALATYAGTAMTDATLQDRLQGVHIPTLVLWGDADRIVDTEYGRAFAAAIPGARFQLLPETGHVPQIETPQQLLEAIRAFVAVTP
jgi:pimeloyl-ACP methyl ester carboxylesterase